MAAFSSGSSVHQAASRCNTSSKVRGRVLVLLVPLLPWKHYGYQRASFRARRRELSRNAYKYLVGFPGKFRQIQLRESEWTIGMP